MDEQPLRRVASRRKKTANDKVTAEPPTTAEGAPTTAAGSPTAKAGSPTAEGGVASGISAIANGSSAIAEQQRIANGSGAIVAKTAQPKEQRSDSSLR